MNLAKLAAKFLRDYSDLLSNKGCNDYIIENTPENREFALRIEAWADDDYKVNLAGYQIYLLDWMVVLFVADELEKDIKK